LLQQADWAVQDCSTVNLAAAGGVAVREPPSAGGEADNGLFLSRKLVGVVEAKKLGATLGGVEAQTLAYASETLPGLTVPSRPRQRGACSHSTGRPGCASGWPRARRSKAACARRRP
jgi:hypothetical protein